MSKNWIEVFKSKIKNFDNNTIVFTKSKQLDWLEERNDFSIEEMKYEILTSKGLVFVEKQEIEFQGITEERFKCYFVYSLSKGRCYVIKFNSIIKVVTVFPIGRATLKKYRKKLK